MLFVALVRLKQQAVRGELPSPLLPLRSLASGLLEHDTVIAYLLYGSAFTRETDLSRNRQTLCSWKGAQVPILAQSQKSGNPAIERYKTQANAIVSNTGRTTLRDVVGKFCDEGKT